MIIKLIKSEKNPIKRSSKKILKATNPLISLKPNLHKSLNPSGLIHGKITKSRLINRQGRRSLFKSL